MRLFPRLSVPLLLLVLGVGLADFHRAHAQDASPVASPEAAEIVRSVELLDGTCGSPGENVILLADISIPDRASDETPVGFSVTTVDQSIPTLESSPMAISVIDRSSGSDVQVACGAVTGTPVGSDLFIGLPSLTPEREAGVAWLHDNGNATTTITVFFSIDLLSSAPASGTPEAQS